MLYLDKFKENHYILFKVLTSLFYAVVFGLILSFILIQMFMPQKAVKVFGFSLYIVSYTGSMEPELSYNDLIVVENYDFEDLKVGDTITFMAKLDDESEIIVTHKIIDEHTVDGVRMLRTQGVNNRAPDIRPVTLDGTGDTNVYIGKFAHKNTFLGYLFAYLGSTIGLLTIAFDIIVVLIIYFFLFPHPRPPQLPPDKHHHTTLHGTHSDSHTPSHLLHSEFPNSNTIPPHALN